MNMNIDNDEPAVTQVVSTLTSTHPDVAKLETETKQQQQMIVNMERQIHTLQQSVQELVQYKTQEEENKVKFGKWQQDMAAQMETVGGVAHDTKQGQATLQQGQATLQQDLLSVKQDLCNIMILLQGGISATPTRNPARQR